jgi:dihydropyrimidinase
MAEYDLIILNGLVVTDDKTAELDIAVKNGKIAKLFPRGKLDGVQGKKFIEAQGGIVMVSQL